MSTVGIVQVLLTLNTEVAISRYYYDAKNEQDFKEFCSTSCLCIYNHRTTKTNQKYPSVNL